jgi:heme/copper-type cytochrome/quinol oxidase subunit 3
VSRRAVIDVSDLPNVALGSEATIWWGNMLLFAIEGSMFAMVVATYFYLRYQVTVWPPPGADRPSILWPTLTALLLIAACAAALWIDQAAKRRDRAPLLPGAAGAILLGLLALIARWRDFASLDFKWSEHAYGSIVWIALGLHTSHMVACTLESVVMAALLVIGPFREKHFIDVRTTASYWYFVALTWLPFYVTFTLAPR